MHTGPEFNRRHVLKSTGTVLLAAGALDMVGPLASVPNRGPVRARPSDLQFDISAFLETPPETDDGVVFQMPPVHTVFLTLVLNRTPGRQDQLMLRRTLRTIEEVYPYGAGNIITIISYGIPYFSLLPGGLYGSLVASYMPRLLSDTSRYAFEEAIPGPDDGGLAGAPPPPPPPPPAIQTESIETTAVVIEANDVLLMIKSDHSQYISDVISWLNGSNRLRNRFVPSPPFSELFSITSSRYQFVQHGLPRAVAELNSLTYADFINPRSPMWMGFADQHVNAFGPPAICTFTGNSSARFTTAVQGDYFDNGSVQHLSHVTLHMLKWFDMSTATSPPGPQGTYVQRIQSMFHAPNIYPGNADQYTDGGGTAFVPDQNRGPNYAAQTAQGIGTNIDPQTGLPERRMGHLSTLQRSSRASDGTPIHFRMDGPGYDNMDVADGTNQPKNQFTIFVPTADFFATLRANMTSLDLLGEYFLTSATDGIEPFIATTRRQNFLCPPRRHRAFPLLELAGTESGQA
jgi:hypothetical protein